MHPDLKDALTRLDRLMSLWGEVLAADTPEKLAAVADAVASVMGVDPLWVRKLIPIVKQNVLWQLLFEDFTTQCTRIETLAPALVEVEWPDLFRVIDTLHQMYQATYFDEVAAAHTAVVGAAFVKKLREEFGAPVLVNRNGRPVWWCLNEAYWIEVDVISTAVLAAATSNRVRVDVYCHSELIASQCFLTPQRAWPVQLGLNHLIEDLARVVRQPPETDTEAEEADAEAANAPEASS